MTDRLSFTADSLNLNENGEVEIPREQVIGTASELFGDKVYADVEDQLASAVEEIQRNVELTPNPKKDELKALREQFSRPIADTLMDSARAQYGGDLKKSTQKQLERRIQETTDTVVTREYGDYTIRDHQLAKEREDRIQEAQQAGVYFLFCKEDDGADSVYIGEAENVKERLVQHLRDYQSEKEKFYWNTAVIFVGRDLNKALIRYLENRFVEIARSCKRYMVLTKNTYRNTVMKESQVAVMEEFVDNVKILINALGYKVLDPLLQIGTDAVAVDDEELFINTGNTSATGMVTSEGFVVLKGAVVNEKTSAKSLSAGMKKLRDKIFADGKVENMTTTEDILFSSSSAAAEFVLGYSASGPRTWKAKDGRTLKEIEDNATAD